MTSPRALFRLAFALFALALLPLGGARAASLASTGQAAAQIVQLNAQRRANGIPAITTVDNSLAATWCPDEGQVTAPTFGAVLASDPTLETLTPSSSPWSDGPLHQAGMYYPLARAAGWAYVTDHTAGLEPFQECMGFGDYATEPATPTVYAFFAEQGPGAVRPTITVSGEGPFAPQQLAGIAQGTATGPQPILYVLGAGRIKAVRWSLTDTTTGATVPNVHLVTSYDSVAHGYGAGYLGDDAVLIPPPLDTGTVYSGTATFTGQTGECIEETFAFATLRADGSRLGVHMAPLRAAPCPGTKWSPDTTWQATGASGSSASSVVGQIARAVGAGSSREGAQTVAAAWSTQAGLVVGVTLRSGQRLVVTEGGRRVTTAGRVTRLAWPYASTVTVWLIDAAGRSSLHVTIPVTRD